MRRQKGGDKVGSGDQPQMRIKNVEELDVQQQNVKKLGEGGKTLLLPFGRRLEHE